MKILYDALPSTISNIKFSMLYYDSCDIVVSDFNGDVPYANIEPIADIIRDGRVKLEVLSNDDIDFGTMLIVCSNTCSLFTDKIKAGDALGELIRNDIEHTAASYHNSKIFDHEHSYPYLYHEKLRDLLIALGGGKTGNYDIFVMWQILCNANLLTTALAYLDCGYDIMVGSNAINYEINYLMNNSNESHKSNKEMMNIFLPSFDNLNFDEISLLKEKCSDELSELKYYLNVFMCENDGLNIETKKIKLQKAINQFEGKIKDSKYDFFHNIIGNICNFTYIPLLATCFSDIPIKVALALSSGFVIENILYEVRKSSNQLKDEPLYFIRDLKKKYNKLK